MVNNEITLLNIWNCDYVLVKIWYLEDENIGIERLELEASDNLWVLYLKDNRGKVMLNRRLWESYV